VKKKEAAVQTFTGFATTVNYANQPALRAPGPKLTIAFTYGVYSAAGFQSETLLYLAAIL
jgi:hypothetical protein